MAIPSEPDAIIYATYISNPYYNGRLDPGHDPGYATGYLTANSTGGAVRSLRARRAKSRSKVSTRADPWDEATIIASPKSIPPLYQDTARSVTARPSIETRCRLSKASSARPMSARE